jgi:hypothetical protein
VALHPGQLDTQSGNLHLLGAHRLAVGALELVLPVRLGPVEQRLLNQPKRPLPPRLGFDRH